MAWQVEQTVVLINNREKNLNKVLPGEINHLRQLEAEEKITCPACHKSLTISITDTGPIGQHKQRALHEAEDMILRKGKMMLKNKMQSLFPSAKVGQDVLLQQPRRLADLIIVRDNGGLVAVELQSSELKKDELQAINQAYADEAIHCLWLLDYRRLQPGKIKQKMIATVSIGKIETDLLRAGEPLLYLDIKKREIVKVSVPNAINPLLDDEKLRSLGRLPCLVRRYDLQQLRLQQGNWHLDDSYDFHLPSPPELPKRLRDKLGKTS